MKGKLIAGTLSLLAACAAPQYEVRQSEAQREVVEVHHYYRPAPRSENNPGAFFSEQQGNTYFYQVPLEQGYSVQGATNARLIESLANIAAGQVMTSEERSFSIGDVVGTYSEVFGSRVFASEQLLLKVLREADKDGNHSITSDEIKRLLEEQKKIYGSSIDILIESAGCKGEESAVLRQCNESFRYKISSCQENNKDKTGNIRWTASSGKEACDTKKSNELYYAGTDAEKCKTEKSNANYYCRKDQEKRLSECGNVKYYATEKLSTWKGNADYACQSDPTVAVNTCLDSNQAKYDKKNQEITATLNACKEADAQQLQQCIGVAEKKYVACNAEAESKKEKANSAHDSCLSAVEAKQSSDSQQAASQLSSCLQSTKEEGQQCVSNARSKVTACKE